MKRSIFVVSAALVCLFFSTQLHGQNQMQKKETEISRFPIPATNVTMRF